MESDSSLINIDQPQQRKSNMILINKKGIAKINCDKNIKTINPGFPPIKLIANFNNLTGQIKEEIHPIWIIECNNAEYYNIQFSNNDNELYISTLYENDGAVIKITLTDEFQKYKSDTINLEVISLSV